MQAHSAAHLPARQRRSYDCKDKDSRRRSDALMHLYSIRQGVICAFKFQILNMIAYLKKIHLLELFLDIIKVARLKHESCVFRLIPRQNLPAFQTTLDIVLKTPLAAESIIRSLVGHEFICHLIAFKFLNSKLICDLPFDVEVADVDIHAFFYLNMYVRAGAFCQSFYIFILKLTSYGIGLRYQEVT